MNMAELKKINPESGWLEFTLADDKMLKPPVFRCKVRPITSFDGADVIDSGARTTSEVMLGTAVRAISAWDLMDGEKPVPCNDEEKTRLAVGLRVLMAARLSGGGFLGPAISTAAKNLENFLGN
jgi:hypothetical protein